MTNPHCKCDGDGFCERHKINKSITMYEHCQLEHQSSIKYWRAWEEGKLGATAPEDPEMLTRGLGDRVARAIKRVTRGRVKPCTGGCRKRQGVLNSLNGRQYPELTGTEINFNHCTKSLLYYIWPVTGNDVWKWNLDHLKRRMGMFNGTVFFTIATSNDTVPADDVVAYLKDSPCDFDFRVVKNDKRLREAKYWVSSLEKVNDLDPLHITYAAHAKCVRLPWKFGESIDDHATMRWAQVMYETTLDHTNLVAQHLSTHAMTGSFKRYGQFTTPGNHRWHYAGTFYWFRNRDVFQRNWMKVDRRFFGSESWPGTHFKPSECQCLFMENTPDPYNLTLWNQEISPAYEKWKAENGSIHPTV